MKLNARESVLVTGSLVHLNAIHSVMGTSCHIPISHSFVRSNYVIHFYVFSSQASDSNCELSDLDQTALKLDINFAHTTARDWWLFAWNPFDNTCRDKVTTVGGSSRANNDRRVDIYREPGNGNLLELCT